MCVFPRAHLDVSHETGCLRFLKREVYLFGGHFCLFDVVHTVQRSFFGWYVFQLHARRYYFFVYCVLGTRDTRYFSGGAPLFSGCVRMGDTVFVVALFNLPHSWCAE